MPSTRFLHPFMTSRKVQHLVLPFLLIALAALMFPPSSAVAGPPDSIDHLRGRWTFVATELNQEPLQFDIFVNDLAAAPSSENTNEYVGAGCMGSFATDIVAPMSLSVVDLGDGVYELSLLSTGLLSSNTEPVVLQFFGTVETAGGGVPDDLANGVVRSGDGLEGVWQGVHHDRRRSRCPSTDETPELYFHGYVNARVAYQGDAVTDPRTMFEGFTNIVSSAMLATAADGETFVVPFYTDLFSPDVDFISEFRFLNGYEGYPISGQAYTFVLLDSLGQPIPGTMRSDTWTMCFQDPPRNVQASVTVDKDIHLSWDAVPLADGFDPANDIGFYQIGIWPQFDSSTDYGANGIGMSEHFVPWTASANWPMGIPDGWDAGHALSELDDGEYLGQVEAFSFVPEGSPGQRLECAVWDETEHFRFLKSANQIQVLE